MPKRGQVSGFTPQPDRNGKSVRTKKPAPGGPFLRPITRYMEKGVRNESQFAARLLHYAVGQEAFEAANPATRLTLSLLRYLNLGST
jgi:hypothetical protein